MSEDLVTIEVNGQPLEARKGEMLIRATDRAGVYVPRFCYHEKLSVAANCRMCLVEVEKAPKPLPACATPVAEGMKVYTRSPKAISAQRATMEFLLINHPLDCPICDQGGECELQDLAMGFGRDVSRYTERKRVVKDKNLGPLVSTDMTRCIHCTRCVRFGQEVAGIQELGTTGRGEHMEIGTYIERSVDHELSGNIIDLCPVGALNNKPYRYSARAWEMTQHEAVGPHDCVGSSMFVHVLRGTVRRVVPRPNDAINETWLSDRDRFSYEGIYSQDRLQQPLVRDGDEWRVTSWQAAIEHVATRLRETIGDDGDDLGVLASPSATVEEHYLLARIARHLGSPHVDHRLRMRDFRDQANDPAFPALGVPLEAVDRQDAIFAIGSNLRMEVPILAHRVRKAATRGGRVSFLNPDRYAYLFPVSAYFEAEVEAMPRALAGVVAAAAEAAGRDLPANVRGLVQEAEIPETARRIASELVEAGEGLVVLGLIATRHPAFADLRALAGALAELTGCRLGYLSEGSNGAGAALAGVLPHRTVGGAPVERPGLTVKGMLESPRKAYLLHGLEPDQDLADRETGLKALESADFVVALTPWDTPALRGVAHVLLPVGTFAETAGTFVNAEGRWQSFAGCANPVGQARPAWKVLRVLGNLVELPDCDYESAVEVRDELAGRLRADAPPDTRYQGEFEAGGETRPAVALELLDVPIYAVDALVRRAAALQATRLALAPREPIPATLVANA